jgi:hypothetical protein
MGFVYRRAATLKLKLVFINQYSLFQVVPIVLEAKQQVISNILETFNKIDVYGKLQTAKLTSCQARKIEIMPPLII